TDGLTGLYNHRFFRESTKHEIARAIRYNKKLSLMILDLDDIKIVNDTYGHTDGDKDLYKVGGSIKERWRETDIECRYGGDESVIILPETDKKEADEVAKRILAKASELEFLDRDIKISLSYGISELDPDNPENLLIQADDRLYDVKRNNKDKESK